MSLRLAPWAIAAVATAILGACSSQQEVVAPATQVKVMSDLRAGKLAPSCVSGCERSWNDQVRAIFALNRVEHWSDLTIRVVAIGYGSDLAYFYLGRAAQGMGYHQAAIGYYAEASALADGSNARVRCAGADHAEDRCQGARISAEVPSLIAASRAALLEREAENDARQQAPVRPHHNRVRAAPMVAAGSGRVDDAKGGALQRVSGLAQAINTATLQVHGRTIPLAGVVGRSDAYAAQLQALIDAQGTTVRCVRAGSGYACMLPNGQNVARAALANGIATVAADAPDDFRAQQEAARAAHRGLWKPTAGASG